MPDADWLVSVISTLRPEAYIFDKGYIPGIEKPVQVNPELTVDNNDGFWTGQPLLAELSKSKSNYSVLNRLAGGSKIDAQIANA
jgi:hypothetical protein